MTKRMNYLKVILLLNALAVYESAAICPLDLVIPHGYYNVTTNGTILLFGCEKGFFLYGTRSAQCFNDSWSHQPPYCITNSCRKVELGGSMRMEAKYEGSQLSFSCAAGFELEGNNSTHCNGSHWSAPIPECVEKRGSLSCDFEKEDLCGWSLDQEGDFDWTWHSGSTPTQFTGPNYDHTLGQQGKGHYLFIETSPPQQNGFQAILKSPFYMPDESGQCFSFWYHSHGSGSLSRLEVFVWKEGEKKEDLTPRFTLDYVTGREWQNETFYIPLLNQPFQIIFIGTRLKGPKHDIAIDDVSLGPCPENMMLSTVVIITTTELTTSVNPPTTVAEVTTKQTSATTRESVSADTTSVVSSQISTSNFSGSSGQTVKESSSSVAESTSVKNISSEKITPSVFNVHDMKPGLNPGNRAAEVKNDVLDSVNDRKMDTMAVSIAVGVVAMVAVTVIVATVYYLHLRRRRAKFTTEEMVQVRNPIYDVNLDHEEE